MKRILLRISRIATYAIASIIAFALLGVTLLMLLLNTEPGTRLTLRAASGVIPGELTWEGLEGDLLNELSFAQLSYEQDGTDVQLQDLYLQWRPWRLLGGQLHVRELRLGAAQVNLPAARQPQDSAEPIEKIELPDIRLPLSLRLDRVALNAIDFQQGELSQHVESVRLRLNSREDRFNIQRFAVSVPQGELSLNGFVEPVGNYPLDLEFEAQSEIPSLGKARTDGRIHGNTDQLSLEQTLSGIISANIEASAEQVTDFSALSWQANVHLTALDMEQTNALINDVDLRVEGSGSINSVDGHADADAVLVDYGDLAFASEFKFADNRLDISQFEVEVPAYEAEANLNGFAQLGENLSVDFNGDISVLEFTLSELGLTAQGNEEGAQQLQLQGQTLAGDLNIEGSLLWSPVLSWDLTTNLSDFDTGTLLSQFPGTVSLLANTQGQLGDQLEAQLQIESLSGDLRELALDGRGALNVQGSSITAQNLQLQWGDNRVLADGALNENEVSLNWELDFPQIDQALPDASGTLQSTGQLSGSVQRPQVQMTLSASALSYADYHVEGIEANFDIDSDLARLPTGQLRLSGIEVNDHRFDSLELQMAEGGAQAHEAELTITSDTLQAELAMQGSWDAQTQRWDGNIDQFRLRYPDMGRWSLAEPTPLSLSPTAAKFSDLCLMVSTRDSELCASAQWDQAQDILIAALDADTISFQVLAPWMLPAVSLDGEFDVNGELERRGTELSIDLTANLHETRLAAPEQDISVLFDSGELLRVTGNQDNLDLALSLQSQQIEADINSQATIRSLFTDPTIDGDLGIEVEDLSLLSILNPSLENVAGMLDGAFDFSGPLTAPTISGSMQLEDGRADVPSTGLALENIRATVEAPNSADSPITFTAAADAGDGQIEVDGNYSLSDQRANVSIVGDAFPALRTRDLDVTVAPDLQIEYTPELLKLRGSVTVPSARITPPDIESTDSVSSDTRLVNGEGSVYDESVTGLPTDMNIEVRLGDDVQVEAYGFEGRLTGRLRTIDEPGREMRGVGNIGVATGLYEIYGQSLSIRRGSLIFTGGPIANPGLDLRVERERDMDNVTVGAQVGGTLQNPSLSLFSTPPMQDSAILSYLIFGRGPGESSQGEQNMLARASLALGMSGGNRVGERLSDTLGVDEVMLDSGDTFESTSLYIGKQISSRLYVKYGIGLVEPVTTFFIRYRLTEHLDFESQTGSESSGADLFYSIER
jgi:translocation and assembly module TamB